MAEIDTSAPFESVREAATRFGGFGFWKHSSHYISEASQVSSSLADSVAKASELEKEVITKKEETLKVLKFLESTKAIVEELKSKLQHKDDKHNCDLNVLNQSKINLYKTTQDLATIQESVELLNKSLEEEKATLENRRERLDPENAAEICKEIQRLSFEVKEFSKTAEKARSAIDKALSEIEHTRNKIETAEMCLVAARKMKEAARVAEAAAISEIKAVTDRRRTKYKMEAEETLQRKRSSSETAKYKMDHHLMDVNGDGTSTSVAVMKQTMSIGQILSRKLLLGDESAMMMNGRVSLGQILGKTNIGKGGNGVRKEKEKRLNGKRKRLGFANFSGILNKESKKKKIALNLK